MSDLPFRRCSPLSPGRSRQPERGRVSVLGYARTAVTTDPSSPLLPSERRGHGLCGKGAVAMTSDGDDEQTTEAIPLAFLAGGGEVGARTRAFDWSKTPLGPTAAWPQSLKTAVQIMLNSRYPMFLAWGRR